MLPFDNNIISVIDEAYKAGFNIPQKFFKDNPQQIDVENREVFQNYPLFIIKPEGIEFSYLLFWSGNKFYGGYVSINNNYTSVQRGTSSRNGETLFAGHVQDVRKCYKKIITDKPTWIARSFVLGNDGVIYYWGLDNIEHYAEQIYALTGFKLDEITDKFLKKEKTYKPEGFISSIMIKSDGVNRYIQTTRSPHKSISKSWADLYGVCDKLDKEFEFTKGIDSYIRKGFSLLHGFKKIS